MRKHWRWWQKTALTILILLLAVGGYWQWRLRVLRNLQVQHSSTPTVFVAGDYAGAFSSNGFTKRLSAHQITTRAMLIKVSYNGQIKVQQFHDLKNNPTIQVVFADNHHWQRQAKQLKPVLQLLASRYHVKTVNAVGHSSGGNIIFQYLLNNPGQVGLPKMQKFVSIGTNYPAKLSNIDNLPKDLQIENIAGRIWHFKGDLGVNYQDVLQMRKLVQDHVASYQEHTIQGSPLHAEHSMLHINPDVDRLIAEFLYRSK